MNDFGIYIHWPYCLSKCPYCDFNSHIADRIDADEWVHGYMRAIDAWRQYRAGQKLGSVYFGGGTPSTAPIAVIEFIINKINDLWDISQSEITLEANPSSVDQDHFAALSELGIHRVSLGVQALNDPDLKALGRAHNVDEALRAYEMANRYFDRVSIDLIYARQNQKLADWQAELQAALRLSPQHISLYQLTIEPGTRFGSLYKQGLLGGLPDTETETDMYTWTSEFMRENGFEHYEISNFAKPNQQSQHNLNYWRYGDYLGIGPGAHGRVRMGNRYATTQTRSPAQWLGQPNQFQMETLEISDQLTEYLLLSLRMREGADLSRLIDLGFDPSRCQKWIETGYIAMNNHSLSLTDKGRMIMNRIVADLLPE